MCRRLTDSQIEFFKMVDEKVASVSVCKSCSSFALNVARLNSSCRFSLSAEIFAVQDVGLRPLFIFRAAVNTVLYTFRKPS